VGKEQTNGGGGEEVGDRPHAVPPVSPWVTRGWQRFRESLHRAFFSWETASLSSASLLGEFGPFGVLQV
jgi:hypothetical protein